MLGQLMEWGGQGPVVHVAHASGFPPGTYRRLVKVLPSARVVEVAEATHFVPMECPAAVAAAVVALMEQLA